MLKTTEEIKEYLEFAASVMRRLPTVKVQGYICSWPKFCRKDEDMSCMGDTWLPPLPEEISAMEEILEWLKFTSVEKRRIVWLRSCGMGWKSLAHHYKMSRSTLSRLYRTALIELQTALKEVPESKNRYLSQSLAENWFEACC